CGRDDSGVLIDYW
nr:immunoglobulin heavy chain junction region [Macaca mulatta]MOX61109.1 immunoglobulin heavy chain junction region [Macaca mulatta]MOX62794.1 immunoglobulin heavy chain junction region [Macaca mulatta]MOX66457.1 immunoglobulin heavy chain junction region [Macaca mulatta]MOX67585.1 immunoglobulin heavy chain junction region [Macaca mulatta]